MQESKQLGLEDDKTTESDQDMTVWSDDDKEEEKSTLEKKPASPVLDPWMQIRFVKCKTKNTELESWIVKIPNQNETIKPILLHILRKSDDAKLRQSISFCGCKVIKDDKSGRAPVRLSIRLTIFKQAPMTCQQCIEYALTLARAACIDVYHDWKTIVKRPETSGKFFHHVEIHSDQHISFLLKNATLGMANALRRTMIADCPTIAMEKMVIHTNTSAYLSNFLALHFAMMPLATRSLEDINAINSITKCTCFKELEYNPSHLGCAKCTIRLKIKAHHNYVAKKMLPYRVTSRDIQIHADDAKRGVSLLTRPMFFIKLDYGQEIDIDVIATRGTLADHGKFGPCCPAVFVPRLLRINIDNEQLSPDQICVLLDSFSDVFELDSTNQLVAKRNLDCTDVQKSICSEMVASWGIPNAIKFVHSETDFVFNVTSTGAIPPLDIVRAGLQALIAKMDTMLDLLPNYVYVELAK